MHDLVGRAVALLDGSEGGGEGGGGGGAGARGGDVGLPGRGVIPLATTARLRAMVRESLLSALDDEAGFEAWVGEALTGTVAASAASAATATSTSSATSSATSVSQAGLRDLARRQVHARVKRVCHEKRKKSKK